MKPFTKQFIALLLFLFACSIQLSAQGTFSGSVTANESGEPLIGASILEKGTTKGTITDDNGAFSYQSTQRTIVLVVSYTGYKTIEVTAQSGTNVDVKLSEDASIIGEVVVIGYGNQLRSKITGAVGTISSDEITELPVLRIEQSLQGRVAGVVVSQNSGSPGSALTVRVRGTGTINNSDPLYIVDGIPVEGLDFLNPADVESINLLKDASAAAIYGARGANGVVLITTKQGKLNQKGTISYENYFGMQSTWKLPRLLSASQYATLSNEAHVAAGVAPLPEFTNPAALGAGTDWVGAIFNDAPMSNHQLTVQGGSEKSTYTLTGNVFNQQGIVGGEKSAFERYTVRANGNQQVRKWLTVGTSVGLTSLTRNGLPENNEFTTPLIRALNMDPLTPIRKTDGTYAYSSYSDTDIVNPLNAIEQTYDQWHSDRIVGNVYGSFAITPSLTFKSTYSLDMTFAKQRIFFPQFDLSYDPELGDAPAGEKKLVNSVVVNNNIWSNKQWENLLTWQKKIGKNHELNILGGTTRLEGRHTYDGGANTNLPSNRWEDAYISNTIDPIASQSSYSGLDESALLSYFTRVNYDFASKYVFSATMRADGSSRFGANNRYGYFPSVSGAWVISREDFYKSKMLTFLKLRASWGVNGNDKIGNYSYTTIVNSGQNYTFGPGQNITNGSVPLTSANPDLKWETITQSDLGLDAEFYDGKLSFTGDVYLKNTTGMLFAAPIPLTAGTEAPIRNVASVVNKGLELALNYRNMEKKFKYSFGGNIAFVQNEVTGLGEGGEPVFGGRVQQNNSDVTKTDIGLPIGSFYGYQTDGIFQNQSEIEAAAYQNEATAPGDIRFKDLNADGVIDVLDQTVIGNPSPDFTYAGTFDFAYAGFDFSGFIQGSQGNDIYNATVRYDFTYVNRPIYALERWTGEGTSTFEPRVNLKDPNQNARVSDRFVEDGSYVRLKNLQIGYNLPKSVQTKLHLSKFRIYASVQNLYTITKYSGMDPEIGAYGGALNMGIDRGFYPQSRVYLSGIQLTF
jgi:TonB-dependent starch-binding outer membrane protein SusC